MTPLFDAILFCTPLIEPLLNAGANVNSKIGKKGKTVLCCAARHSSLAVVRLLVERGANIHAGALGMTLVDYAVLGENRDVLKFLRTLGGHYHHHVFPGEPFGATGGIRLPE
jgi:ankyrin repeat protein